MNKINLKKRSTFFETPCIYQVLAGQRIFNLNNTYYSFSQVQDIDSSSLNSGCQYQRLSSDLYWSQLLYDRELIGVGRFRILGGARFRIFGRPRGGQIPSRHMTSERRRCDVMTSHRRHLDVVCPLGF